MIPLTVIEDSDSVIKGHGLDVERSQDRFLVRQGGVVVGRHLNMFDLLPSLYQSSHYSRTAAKE